MIWALCEGSVEQIGHTEAAAVHLVGVGGADAAFGGADLLVTEGDFTGRVQFLVERKDDVGAVGDEQFFGGYGNALAFNAFDFDT